MMGSSGSIEWGMLITITLAKGSADPKTEEFDQLSAEGPDYKDTLESLEARVPEGWQVSSILTDR